MAVSASSRPHRKRQTQAQTRALSWRPVHALCPALLRAHRSSAPPSTRCWPACSLSSCASPCAGVGFLRILVGTVVARILSQTLNYALNHTGGLYWRKVARRRNERPHGARASRASWRSSQPHPCALHHRRLPAALPPRHPGVNLQARHGLAALLPQLLPAAQLGLYDRALHPPQPHQAQGLAQAPEPGRSQRDAYTAYPPCSGRTREDHRDRGSLTKLALKRHVGTVQRGCMLDDGKSEPRPAACARARRLHAIEPLEDLVLRLLGDAYARVRGRHPQTQRYTRTSPPAWL